MKLKKAALRKEPWRGVVVLAVDASIKSSGWCIGYAGQIIAAGAVSLRKSFRGVEGVCKDAAGFAAMKRCPWVMVIEAPGPTQKISWDAKLSLGGAVHIWQVGSSQVGLKEKLVLRVQPSSWRGALFGAQPPVGHAKDFALAYARSATGRPFETHDEAEAYAIMKFASSHPDIPAILGKKWIREWLDGLRLTT